ncbi:MAG: helix-turn-helix transcriptional regulator [Lachnospiraceae bacterium]|nr:helix-turn-helix transcriptional regulator [Lachnospiraceae bacterium]
MTNIEIGNRIKYARELRNVTLDYVAQKVGVTKSTVQRYENGKINSIKIPVVESIAIALNVNPSWIVGKSNVMELPLQKVPEIIKYYEALNAMGKYEATKRVEELTHIDKYILSNENYIENEKFSNVKDAKKYLKSQKLLAALKEDEYTIDADILTIANAIYKHNKPPLKKGE